MLKISIDKFHENKSNNSLFLYKLNKTKMYALFFLIFNSDLLYFFNEGV